jgi:uncharacterized protein
MPVVALLLFGLIVGTLSGLLGIGGGIVLVPGLMLLFGLAQPEAQGTSLAVLSLPIALCAAFVYWQHDYVRLPMAGLIACGFAVGAVVGANLVQYLPLTALRIMFGGVLLYIGFSFVLVAPSARPKAILPQVLAATLAWIVACVWRRYWPASRPAPAPWEVEYHI